MIEIEESLNKVELSDELLELTTCKICNNKYEDPIVLPCFKTACLKHFTKIDNKFKCSLCQKEHEVPLEGFRSDENMIRFIQFGQSYVSVLDFGEINIQAKNSCDDLDKIIKNCEAITSDYFNYIDDYFGKLRNEIDLKKEEFMLTIDENHQRVLKKLKKEEDACLAQAEKKTSDFNEIIKTSQAKLKEWYQHLKIPNFSHSYNKYWKNINLKAEQESTKLSNLLASYHDELFLFKECKFQPREIVDNNNFGDLKIINKEEDANFNLNAKLRFKIEKFKSFIDNFEWRESKEYCLVNNIMWRFQMHIEKTNDFSLGLFVYIYPDCTSDVIQENPTKLSTNVLIIQNSQQILKAQTFEHKIVKRALLKLGPISSLKDIMNTEMNIYDKQNDFITVEVSIKSIK